MVRVFEVFRSSFSGCIIKFHVTRHKLVWESAKNQGDAVNILSISVTSSQPAILTDSAQSLHRSTIHSMILSPDILVGQVLVSAADMTRLRQTAKVVDAVSTVRLVRFRFSRAPPWQDQKREMQYRQDHQCECEQPGVYFF